MIPALLLAVAVAQPAAAGNGTFDNGKYGFCVSVRFNATPAELARIRTVFEAGSQIFADALDGQQQFGTIRLVNGSGASESAEYWINPGTNTAHATEGRYGVRGQHVNMYFDSNFTPGDPVGDAYRIAHEHIHHAFGVLDEYKGPNGTAECAPPPDSATLSFSLMDNFFTRGGQAVSPGGTYTLNELCVAANHDPDGDTAQEHVHGMSAWETIAAHPTRSATAPSGLPVDAPPAPHTVNIVEGFGGLRVVLLLDRSGSMSSQNRLEFAKRGGRAFVGRLENGDSVGVASFECSTSVDFPITTISGSGTIAAARSAIDSLSAGGSTNIGGGLQAALGTLTSRGTRSCNEIIVLLSDGDHNCGTAPNAVIPQLQQEGVSVISVGVGSGLSTAGEATLQNVASATGGQYFRVDSSFDLIGLFLRLVAETLGNGMLTRTPERIATGEVREVAVSVEKHVKSATFALAIGDDADQLLFTLQTPGGHVITESSTGTNPNVEFEAESNSRVFRVADPEAGQWKMVVSAGNVVSGELELLAFAEHDGVDLLLVMEKEAVAFPERMRIEATPIYEGVPVLGVEIAGTVRRPDGSAVPIALRDDGSVAHGDHEAADGVYGAIFDNFSVDGTYTFELAAESVNDPTYGGESLFASPVPSKSRETTFTRRASVAAILTGSPGVMAATLELMPEPLDFRTKGNLITAHLELPAGSDPADIDPATVHLSAVDGNQLASPIPILASSATLGDFDNDGVPDLTVKFSRRLVEPQLSSGVQEVVVEGQVGNQLFRGTRSFTVVPRNAVPDGKDK
jgi:Mg-chelatase subunit ChlD